MATVIKPIRDKNPINLRPFKYPYYIGQVGLDGDGEAIFGDWISGIRAGVMDLNIKIDKDGYNTLNTLIPIFAPSSDGNDTQAYISYVSNVTGFDPNQVLISDDATIKSLFRAMAGQEMGYLSKTDLPKPFTDNDIDLGIQYYATNEYPVRIQTAFNGAVADVNSALVDANNAVPGIDWIVFLIGCGMVGHKIYKHRKKNKR